MGCRWVAVLNLEIAAYAVVMVECEGKNAQVKISSFNGYLFFSFCHPKKQSQYSFVIQKVKKIHFM
jgi:hypothetical protein